MKRTWSVKGDWSVEAWSKHYMTSKGCPMESPQRFETRLEAENEARVWAKNPTVKLIRILNRVTGRFYCMDRADPRYPGGTVQPWWVIFSPNENAYLSRAYPTRERAQRELDKMIREGRATQDVHIVESPSGWVHTTRPPDESVEDWERRLKAEEGIE